MKQSKLINRLLFIFIAVAVLGCLILSGCSVKSSGTIILATTTSTENTGLLTEILKDFTAKTGIEVKVIAVGTGQALELGKTGEADVLLVHARSSEEAFVQEGFGSARYDVMYNDFVLAGSTDDPAALKIKTGSDIDGAFSILKNGNATFISRGDNSGTHKKELEIWKKLNVKPKGDWYVSAGKGMGEVLQMADEMKAYTLTDRGTWLSMAEKLDMIIVVEGDKVLFNQYGVIPVNTDKYKSGQKKEADAFVSWILSKETQKLIGEFGRKKYGQSLFVPNAVN